VLLGIIGSVMLLAWWHSNSEDRRIQAQAEQDAAALQGLLDLSRSTPPPNAIGDLTRIPPSPAFQSFQGPNIQTHRPVVTINADGSRSTTWIPRE
jgi:hypothetical protein